MERTSLQNTYSERSADFFRKVRVHSARMNVLSLGRLVVIGLLVWFIIRGIRTDQWIWYLAASLSVVVFLVLVSLQGRLQALGDEPGDDIAGGSRASSISLVASLASSGTIGFGCNGAVLSMPIGQEHS